jgi:hypothetical protein
MITIWPLPKDHDDDHALLLQKITIMITPWRLLKDHNDDYAFAVAERL